jgi:hypothetical protein
VRRPHDDKTGYRGLTDPSINPDQDQSHHDLQNRIATIFAGAHVKPNFAKPGGITHVNILRTIEAIYGLPKSVLSNPMRCAPASATMPLWPMCSRRCSSGAPAIRLLA